MPAICPTSQNVSPGMRGMWLSQILAGRAHNASPSGGSPQRHRTGERRVTPWDTSSSGASEGSVTWSVTLRQMTCVKKKKKSREPPARTPPWRRPPPRENDPRVRAGHFLPVRIALIFLLLPVVSTCPAQRGCLSEATPHRPYRSGFPNCTLSSRSFPSAWSRIAPSKSIIAISDPASGSYRRLFINIVGRPPALYDRSAACFGDSCICSRVRRAGGTPGAASGRRGFALRAATRPC